MLHMHYPIKLIYIQLYKNAENAQDKLSAFEAAIFCKCWNYEKIQQMQNEEMFFKSKIIDIDDFNSRIQKLIDGNFFE